MQEIQNTSLLIFQSAVIISLILLVAGVIKPGWFLFWMKAPKPFFMFVIGSVIFMGCYFGYSLKVGSPAPIAAIHALILFSILFLVLGLINPSWVFGTTKLDRIWVMAIGALLFMGFMTLQGVYYGPKNKRPHTPAPESSIKPQKSPQPAAPEPGSEL
ncbi:MAG: hypothetical protein ACPW60_01600 [Methylohalobius sp. ZOD2]